MRNRLLVLTKTSIPYIKELRPTAGSVTAVILWQQLDYWFSRYPDGFFKFMSPPEKDHPSYRPGDSWIEELGFSEKEFRNAFDKIGLRYSSKTNFNKAENKFLKGENEYFFASYQDKLKKMTFYYRNHEKADTALDELVTLPAKKKKKAPPVDDESESIVDDQRAATVDDQTEATHLPKGNLPSLPKGSYPPAQREAGVSETISEITSETTTETKAAVLVSVDNSLSEEQEACWKWAKTEKFWSSKVYSEKAFLSLYNAESGALKGQFKNWQELNKTEEEKKVKPKVPEVWERQGFKTEKEYNDFMFKKQTEKYTKTKTGSLA